MTASIREAVVMAAGEGRRLRPLTERWPKPILPIDGRPVIATLLRDLAAAGIACATVVTGHLREQVEALVGDGRAFGLEVRFALQPSADGSADAVARGLASGAEPPCLISAADTVYTPGAVGSFRERFATSEAAGAIARRGLSPGLVDRVRDVDAALPLTWAPLWGLTEAVVPYLDDVPGPPYELKNAYQRAIDDGLFVAAIGVGPTRDLTFPVDLVRENFPYLGSDR